MKIAFAILAFALLLRGQDVEVSLQPVPMRLARANLGDIAKDFGVWRIIACNHGQVRGIVSSARIAFEAADVGLLPKALVMNSASRAEGRSFPFFATNFLRFGSSSISTAIATGGLAISSRGAGFISLGVMAGLEMFDAFKKKNQVFDYSMISEEPLVVESGACVETLGFAKLQSKVKPHKITISDKKIVAMNFKDSGLTAIPQEGL